MDDTYVYFSGDTYQSVSWLQMVILAIDLAYYEIFVKALCISKLLSYHIVAVSKLNQNDCLKGLKWWAVQLTLYSPLKSWLAKAHS